MPTLARDTTPQAEAVLISLWRKKTTAQKLRSIVSMRQMAGELMMSDLRQKHPRASKEDLCLLQLKRLFNLSIAEQIMKRKKTNRNGAEQPISELQIILLVTKRLDALNIPYFIGGSIASIKYGEPRFTRDADLVVRMLPAHVKRFVDIFEPDFMVSAEAIHDSLQRKYAFNIIHIEAAFKIDFFPITDKDELEIAAFARRQRYDIGEDEVWMASAEDVILAKLRWYRMGGEVSTVQWRDVLGVLKVQANALDFDYLEKQATRFGLADLLERAREDAV